MPSTEIKVLPLRKRQISQERLRMLRDLRQKQIELKRLETKLAEKLISELEAGEQVEEGTLQARIVTRQNGNRREHRLIVY